MMLRFTATSDLPKFTYRKGGLAAKTTSGGLSTKVLVEPIVLRHGDTVLVNQGDSEEKWAADWCLSNFPHNFTLETPVRVVEAGEEE